MDVLLSEHAYLYENACEVEYFVENKITDAGKGLVAKAQAAIEKVRKIVKDLWDKLVNWVTTKVTEIKKKFAAKFSKKKVEDTVEVLKKEDKLDTVVLALPGGSSSSNVKALPGGSSSSNVKALPDNSSGSNVWTFGIAGNGDFINEAYITDPTDADKAYEAVGQYYNEKKNSVKIPDSEDCIKIAIAAIYGSNELIGQIKQAQKAADKELFTMERNMKVSAFADTKGTGDEFKKQYNDIMTNFKKCLNSNTYVCKDKVKIFTELTNESVKIVAKLGTKAA